MAAYFLMHVLMIAILSSPAVLYAQRKQTWFGWDLFLIFIPIAIWFTLVSHGFGPQSAGSLMELKGLAVGIPLLYTTRVFVLDRYFPNPRKNSIFIFAVSIALPIGFRFLMPEFLLDMPSQ